MIPFHFTNQTTSVFVLLTFIIYTFSKYTLPRIPRIFLTRGIVYTV
ncbi:MAG: hypothetical protein IAI50_04455 [Candidatus Eremiobacteraeota bacterium]|nr:hypothetical protein [Candidatus Eremiobacteraeota bacterium]